MKLDNEELKRKAVLGDNAARKVFAIREEGSLLLCSLLLGNTAVNSAISVTMSSHTTGLIAGLISTLSIVVFGEILPQAFFSRHALKFGSRMVWFARLVTFIMWPIAKPVSMLIDILLGKEIPTRWAKGEIEQIIRDHEKDSIDSDESRIVLGALSFSEKTLQDVMTPRTMLFMLQKDEFLDQSNLKKIQEENFSRIPVYDTTRDTVVGILYAKSLLHIEGKPQVKDKIKEGEILKFYADTKLDYALNQMISAKHHMSFLYDEYGALRGIVTMEDIIEEILKTEILDESDEIANLQEHAKSIYEVNVK
jgi:metal transporter CNNM